MATPKTSKTSARSPICYGQTGTATWCQEWYETASRDAGKRARQLRKLGYKVFVSSQGDQITSDGRCKMTLVSVYPGSNEYLDLPAVEIH